MNDTVAPLSQFVDGGWMHSFGMAGAWLCWRPWGADDDHCFCVRSDYEAMKDVPAGRRIGHSLPPPVDMVIPPEGILVILTPTQGGFDRPIWRFFPDSHDDRPANDDDFAILHARQQETLSDAV